MQKIAILDFTNARVIVRDIPADREDLNDDSQAAAEYFAEKEGFKVSNSEYMTGSNIEIDIR